MGKLVNGINGPFVGKVGNTIGSSWRGIPYIKSRGHRTKPATEGEKINRFIFGMTQQWLYPLKEFLRIGFNNYTLTNQGVNAAKSFLYKNALIKDGFDSTIDPTSVKVSHGELPLPARMDVELTDENKLIFTWDTECKRVNELDQVMLLAYDIEDGEVSMETHGLFRKTGRDELNVSNLSNFVVYAAFLSADRNSQSDSVYLGSFTTVEITEDEEETETESKTQKTESKIKAASKTKVESKSTDSDETRIGDETKVNDATKTDNNTRASTEKRTLVPSADSVETKTSVTPTDITKKEVVTENKLSLFDPLDEVDENKTESLKPKIQSKVTSADPPIRDKSLPDHVVLTETENIEKQKIPNTEPVKEELKIKNKTPIKQKFTFINSDNEAVKEVQKSAESKQEEPDETVVIKKGRITYYVSKRHLEKTRHTRQSAKR